MPTLGAQRKRADLKWDIHTGRVEIVDSRTDWYYEMMQRVLGPLMLEPDISYMENITPDEIREMARRTVDQAMEIDASSAEQGGGNTHTYEDRYVLRSGYGWGATSPDDFNMSHLDLNTVD